MRLEGLKRQARNIAVAAASCGMLVAGVVAAPSAVAQDGATWTMPALKGSMLQTAIDATYEAAGTEDIQFVFGTTPMTQVVYNYTNWRVCAQSPSAGRAVKITGKPPKVTFRLARPGGC